MNKQKSPNLREILESLPIIDEDELRNSSRTFPAKHLAKLIVSYPLTGIEEQAGFVFGTNKNRTALYISRYSIGEKRFFYNVAEPFLDTHYINPIKFLRNLNKST
jgi:hypothetical protein